MSNVIIVTGGLNQAITVGTSATNGPSFPIKYFLLAYDPNIDPEIHAPGTPTSATAFSGVATFGDVSLIQRGGHYIFKTGNYSLSQEQFLILSGSVGETVFAETQLTSATISNSDKSNSTIITLLNGKPLLNVISGSSADDLYPISPVGIWHSSQTLAQYISADTTTLSLTGATSAFFPIESYTPIMTSAGSPNNILRGIYKCRVGSQYGDFKFNKIGIYIDGGSNPPALIAEAMLNTVITKTKTGTSITNLEFDIEIEFHTEGTFSNVVYMTEDYWVKIPTVSGYGLFTDTDVAIGSSGVGWLPKAKFDISSENNSRPVLCLNNRYGVNYMFMDIVSASDSSAISGASTLNFFTTSHSNDSGIDKFVVSINKYEDYTAGGMGSINGYDVLGDLRDIVKAGFSIDQNRTVSAFNNNVIHRHYGFYNNLFTASGTTDVIGVYTKITHRGLAARKTVGGYFEINANTSDQSADCTKIGTYVTISGYGNEFYGSYTDILINASNNNAASSYGSFVKNIGGRSSSFGSYMIVSGAPDGSSQYGVYTLVYGAQSNAYGVYAKAYARSGSTSLYGVYSTAQNLTSDQLEIYGGYFKGLSYYAGATADVYGVYAESISGNATGMINRSFGICAIAFAQSGKFNYAYGGYFRAPAITNSYAISADGHTYLRGSTTMTGAVTVNGTLSINGIDFVGAVPAGTIVMWPINSPIPDGWLVCSGSYFGTSVYPDLYAAIAFTYGYRQETSSPANIQFRIPCIPPALLPRDTTYSGNSDPGTFTEFPLSALPEVGQWIIKT